MQRLHTADDLHQQSFTPGLQQQSFTPGLLSPSVFENDPPPPKLVVLGSSSIANVLQGRLIRLSTAIGVAIFGSPAACGHQGVSGENRSQPRRHCPTQTSTPGSIQFPRRRWPFKRCSVYVRPLSIRRWHSWSRSPKERRRGVRSPIAASQHHYTAITAPFCH